LPTGTQSCYNELLSSCGVLPLPCSAEFLGMSRPTASRNGALWILGLTVALGAALAIALAGTRPASAPLETVGGWSTTGAYHTPGSNPPAGDNYTLELLSVIPHHSTPYAICGEDDERGTLFAAAYYTREHPIRRIGTTLMDARGDTLAAMPDHWLVGPTASRWPDPELLIWHPNVWYEQASPAHRHDRRYLFRHNYAREPKIIRRDGFMRALRAAARGESLCVESRLIAGVPGEPERFRVPIDPLFTADDSSIFQGEHEGRAIAYTDGGFHNADQYYILFDQPVLPEGEKRELRRTDDIEGGYRGLFSVDLETGYVSWSRRTGPSIVRVMAGDMNSDGADEFLVQYYNPENGVSGDGTTDAGTSYVQCLDRRGYLLWLKRFVGVFIGVSAAIADVTGDGDLDVVAVCASTRYKHMGHAAVISGDGETLAERSDLGSLYGITVADFDGDGADEIVTGAPGAQVLMMDGDLEIVASATDTVDFRSVLNWTNFRGEVVPDIRKLKIERYRALLIPLASYDLDGDGELEIVCLATASALVRWSPTARAGFFPPRGDIVILGSSLEEEARCVVHRDSLGIPYAPYDSPASLKIHAAFHDVDGDGVDELLFSSTRGFFIFKVTLDE